MGALFSFLGGSVFRSIWGEFSAWLTAKQEHKHEMERMQAQEVIDAGAHARNLEAIRVQSDLGIKTIETKRDAEFSTIEIDAWAEAVKSVGRKSGYKFVDIWNGSIRPAFATMAMIAIVIEIIAIGHLSDWDKELFAAFLGIYAADRSLKNRGK